MARRPRHRRRPQPRSKSSSSPAGRAIRRACTNSGPACLLFQKALSGVPGVNVQVYFNGWPTKTVDGQVVDDNAALDKADAVLIYADGGKDNPAIQGDRIKVIDALAARGVGLGFAHYAVEVPAGEPGDAMHRWIGGFYEDHYSVNPMWKPPFERFPDASGHARREAVRNPRRVVFQHALDEDAAAKSRITPLLVATPSDEVRKGPYVSPKGPYDHIIAASGKPETMMWVYERPDGGRSFGFTGGHTHAHWGDRNQRKLMLNALLWLAKVDVPAQGVEDTITDADLTLNLDDKPVRRTQ